MTVVWILIGPSGAGKSTYVEKELPDSTELCSADHFFMRNDKYEFDPRNLPRAHSACLLNYADALRAGVEHVVVDNTNTTVAEIAPYIALGQAYAANVLVIFFDTPWRVCAERSTKGIDASTVLRMSMQAEDLIRNWPHFWPKIEVASQAKKP